MRREDVVVFRLAMAGAAYLVALLVWPVFLANHDRGRPVLLVAGVVLFAALGLTRRFLHNVFISRWESGEAVAEVQVAVPDEAMPEFIPELAVA